MRENNGAVVTVLPNCHHLVAYSFGDSDVFKIKT